MKRRDLIKRLEANGWKFIREGHDHTLYSNGTRQEPISRQREIPEDLARTILRRNGIK